MTESKGIHSRIAELIIEKVTTIATSLKQVILAYNTQGIKVQHVDSDGQYEHIRKGLVEISI